MNVLKVVFIAIFTFVCSVVFAQVVNNDDGFCYAKLLGPDEYKTLTEKVLVQSAGIENRVIPAEYEIIVEEILVEPESTRMVKVPAEYETITEKVIDVPATVKIVEVPAVTEMQVRKTLLEEERKEKVTIPAEFEIVKKQIVISPEIKRYEYHPAEFETVAEKVLVEEASQKVEVIPAEYEVVMQPVEVAPATTRIEELEPVFEEKEELVLVKPAFSQWGKKAKNEDCSEPDPADCFVWLPIEIPAQYKKVKKMVNVGCDGSGIANSGCIKEIALPAAYETRPVNVIKSPASEKVVYVPAKYKTISRSVVKKPAFVKEIITPETRRTVTEKVLKTPERVEEEIIPATYKSNSVEVVISPPTTREVMVPATYKIVSKKVLKTPAREVEEIVPAKYDTINHRILKTPERMEVVDVPEEYKTVTKQVLVKKGEWKWKRIICPKHQSPDQIKQLQLALKSAGYSPGPVDNIFGPRTYNAMVEFQKANQLWSGQLDYETAFALKLKLKDEAYLAYDGAPIDISDGVNFDGKEELIAMASKGEKPITGKVEIEMKPKDYSTDASKIEDDKNEDFYLLASRTSMSTDELDMIIEINRMRADPKGYIKVVKQYIEEVKVDPTLDEVYRTDEISTAQELINELNLMQPLPLLQPHEGLHQVAVKHGIEVQQKGKIGHIGNDGSYPWDRVKRETGMSDGNENLVAGGLTLKESVLILLVDSGIPGRGHRKTLLNPQWTFCGVYYIGQVGNIPNGWIQVFGSK